MKLRLAVISSTIMVVTVLMGFMPQLAGAHSLDRTASEMAALVTPTQNTIVAPRAEAPVQSQSVFTPTDFQRLLAATPEGSADTDMDGIPDQVEAILGTDPENSDTDFDEVDDYFEANNGLDPQKADSNGDGLADYLELGTGGYVRNGYIRIDGVGDDTQGGGGAIGDIDGNGKLDMVLMAIDNPSGENEFRYKVGWDLDIYGRATGGWTPYITSPKIGEENSDGGADLADLNGNGILDIVLMAIDNPAGDDTFWYIIGWDLTSDGSPANGWSPIVTRGTLPNGGLGPSNQGGGLAIADFGGAATPDVLLMAIDNPEQNNAFRYSVGRDVDADTGQPYVWEQVISKTGLGWSNQGGGAAIANIDGNLHTSEGVPMPDILLMGIDNPSGTNKFWYTIGWDAYQSDGFPNYGWSQVYQVNGFNDSNTGGGAAIADINSNGKPDLLLMSINSAGGPDDFYYTIGWDLDYSDDLYNSGQAESWGWKFSDVSIVPQDTDGDGTADFKDDDNDNDNVPDGLDTSPFSKSNTGSSLHFDIKTGGDPTYIDFQVIPARLGHLYRSLQTWDWHDDDVLGSIQDIDKSKEDLQLVPMLEFSADNLPPQADLEDYGIAVSNGKAYIPLTTVQENGKPVAFNGRMYYPASGPLDISSDAKLAWMVTAELDKGTLSWTEDKSQPGLSWHNLDGDVAVGNINSNNIPDIVLMGIDDGAQNDAFWYQIAWDVDGNGRPAQGWSQIITSPSINNNTKMGAGAVIADINQDSNHRPDLLLMWINTNATQFRWIIGWDLDENGAASSWMTDGAADKVGDVAEGGGVAIGDINRNGKPDLVLMAVDAPSGSNEFRYTIGWDIGSNGQPTRWSSHTNHIKGPKIESSNSGGGIALADIDHNNILDMVLMGIDNPNKADSFWYTIGWDLDTSGVPANGTWSPIIKVGGLGWYNDGGGVALAQLNIYNNLDLVLMGIDDPDEGNNFRYIVGKDILKTTSQPLSGWGPMLSPGADIGWDNAGGDMAIGDINKNDKPDLLLMGVDDGDEANDFRWRIAWDLDEKGDAQSWSARSAAPGLSWTTAGGGAALADIDQDSQHRLDLILMDIDAPDGADSFRYKIGWNLLPTTGEVSHWMPDYITVDGPGWSNEGGGAAIADIDKNGELDLVLMCIDDPSGANAFRYKIGWNLNEQGVASQWSPVVSSPDIGDDNAGGGVVIADMNSNGKLDIVCMGIDNLDDEVNDFCYRIAFDIDTDGSPAGGWSPTLTAPGIGDYTDGGGAGICDIDGDGNQDLLFMGIDDPDGANEFRYKVGWTAQTETGTVCRYTEDFMLTGFNVTENHGSDAGMFCNSGSTVDKDEVSDAYVALRYEFLNSQNALSTAPDKLTENTVNVFSRIESFPHQDAAVRAVVNEWVPDKLDGFTDGQEAPFVFAFQNTTSEIGMDQMVSGSYILGTPPDIDLTLQPRTTSRALSINWYNTSDNQPLEMEDIISMVQSWGYTEAETVNILKLMVVWGTGEIKLSSIDGTNVDFAPPDKDSILNWLRDGISGLEPLVSIPSYIDGMGFVCAVLDTGAGLIPALKTADASMDVVKGMQAASGGITRVSGVVGTTKFQKLTRVLAINAGIAKVLGVVGIAAGTANSLYAFYQIGDASGWSGAGLAKAATFAALQLTFMIATELIAFIPAVGAIVSIGVVLSDFICAQITGEGWSEKAISAIMDALTDYTMLSSVDLEIVSTELDIQDVDGNGVDAHDLFTLKMRVIEKVYRTGEGDRDDVEDSFIKPYLDWWDTYDTTYTSAQGQSREIVSSADHGDWRENTWDITTWWEAKRGARNIKKETRFETEYKIYYDEQFGLTHSRESYKDTSSNTQYQYFDVMHGTLDEFVNWDDIKANDPDFDGLKNKVVNGQLKEVDKDGNVLSTHRQKWDTDGDGLHDGYEMEKGFDPTNPDTDGDGLDDGVEMRIQTDPTNKDTDSDGLTDKEEYQGWLVHFTYGGQDFEVQVYSDPLVQDTDSDGLSDFAEKAKRYNPTSPDTDGDGVGDKSDESISEPAYTNNAGLNTYIRLRLNDSNSSTVKVDPGATVNGTLEYAILGTYMPNMPGTPASVYVSLMLDDPTDDQNVLWSLPRFYDGTPPPGELVTGTIDFTLTAPGAAGIYHFRSYVGWNFLGLIPPTVWELPSLGVVDTTTTIAACRWVQGVQDTDSDGIIDENEETGWSIAFTAADGAHSIHVNSEPDLPDTDYDGLTDLEEFNNLTNPRSPDTDGDGLTDKDEITRGTNPNSWDTDGDGLSDAAEITIGSDPLVVDTDGDGLNDLEEVNAGLNPTLADTDADGIPDNQEITMGTDPADADSDDDGVLDGQEITDGTNPLNPDCDADGLEDGAEKSYGTDPLTADTDGDSAIDGAEVAAGTDPLNKAPVAVNDSYSTPSTADLEVASPGVLANDTDPESNPLSARVAQRPAHGEVRLNPSGSFTYTSDYGFQGQDSFTYTANDAGGNSSAATVSITVTQPLAPSVTAIDPDQSNRGHTLSPIITGTNFLGATAVSLGTGITVNSFTVDSATQITADITIATDAVPGARDVSVTTPGGTATLPNGFTVNESTQQQVNTATGTGTVTFTTSDGSIVNLTALATTPCGSLADFSVPHGYFSFDITNITAGATVTITITLPSNMPTGTQYWKCINGQWVNITSLLGDNDGDNVLTLTLIDGGLGDADGLANGTIVDPGGPGVIVVTPVAPAARRASPSPPQPQLPPADVRLRNISVSPGETQAGQPVTVLANVVNDGASSGSYNVALVINGRVEQQRTIEVSPGAAYPVKFTVTRTQPGTYTVDIGGQKGSFTILSADSRSSAGTGESLLFVAAIAVIAMLVLLLIIVARRRYQGY